MQSKIYCRTTKQDKHAFYVNVNGKEYFLFEQDFKKTTMDFFKNGVSIQALGKYSIARSITVRKTLDKLPTYLRYVEKEYGVEIYEKSKQKKEHKRNKPYKREQFRWQNYAWDIA